MLAFGCFEMPSPGFTTLALPLSLELTSVDEARRKRGQRGVKWCPSQLFSQWDSLVASCFC